MKFNKPILPPSINFYNETILYHRRLNDIDEVIELEVEKDFSSDDTSDKSLKEIHYVSFTNNDTVNLNLTFNDPSVISKIASNPDVLTLKIVKPQVFID